MAKPIGITGYEVKSLKMYLNLYTFPGYIMFIYSIINFILLVFYFEEDVDVKRSIKEKMKQMQRRMLILIIIIIVFWSQCWILI